MTDHISDGYIELDRKLRKVPDHFLFIIRDLDERIRLEKNEDKKSAYQDARNIINIYTGL